MSDFDPIDDGKQPEQVAIKPARDAVKPDIMVLRGMWIANPAKYQELRRQHGLEHSDIWGETAKKPEQRRPLPKK